MDDQSVDEVARIVAMTQSRRWFSRKIAALSLGPKVQPGSCTCDCPQGQTNCDGVCRATC